MARSGGRVIGSVTEGEGGFTTSRSVIPSARRRGLASRLLSEVERRMAKMGVIKVNAVIYKWNDPSLLLSDRHGFSSQDAEVVVGKLFRTTS